MPARRVLTLGLAVLALLGTVAGCGGGSAASAEPRCSMDVGASPDAGRSGTPVAVGRSFRVPARPGTVIATVIAVVDPVTGGESAAGCRYVGVDLVLSNDRSTAATVDLFAGTLLVAGNGHGYQPAATGLGRHTGIETTNLVPGDQRRGRLIFAVPEHAALRTLVLAAGTVRLDLPSTTATPAPPYRPGDWPGLGTTQHLLRQHGEGLDLTPLEVRDPAPATAGVRAGFRAYGVLLRVEVTGTASWPLNPESMVVLIDAAGQQWYPGAVTTPTLTSFDDFPNGPGQRRTAWVVWEVPDRATIVALQAASYPGEIWAWRW